MGCDWLPWYFSVSTPGFQSTHPVWGATINVVEIPQDMRFQSTHPVWGATSHSQASFSLFGFQSTHPVWGATREMEVETCE